MHKCTWKLCGKPATSKITVTTPHMLEWARPVCDEHYEEAAMRMLAGYGTIYVSGL